MRLLTTLALSGLSSLPIALRGHHIPQPRALAVGCTSAALRRALLRTAPPRLLAGDDDERHILSVNTALNFSLPYRVLAFYALAPVDAAERDDAKNGHC